jgi:hypothetical protein
LAERIRATVLHETAHYFGYTERQLRRVGLAWCGAEVASGLEQSPSTVPSRPRQRDTVVQCPAGKPARRGRAARDHSVRGGERTGLP